MVKNYFSITDITSRCQGLMDRNFYGSVTFSFQNGNPTTIKYEETVKPVVEMPPAIPLFNAGHKRTATNLPEEAIEETVYDRGGNVA